MVMTINPVGPGDVPIIPSQEGFLAPGGKDVFASELALALRDKQIARLKVDGKTVDGANSGLDSLGYLAAAGFKIRQTEIRAVSEQLGLSLQETRGVLSQIRNHFMTSIKGSLLRLEEVVRDGANQLPPDLQSRYLTTIEQIKADFTAGFGVDFDRVSLKPSDQNMENLILRLFENRDHLPPALAQKLEAFF